ncbi:MAG TPA: fused MFS/spermidine synthase [Candidatus Saccharimonadales bacterium]|nr:fused MFS/spermidine synthase [Candidatus Saccharimonadales bacterium]
MMRPRPFLICPLFFLSGMAGLGCQMVWSRQFAMGLGTEMVSVLAVVGGFLGGMALGAWLLDSRISCSRSPGRWYAGLELTIGLWVVMTTFFLPRLQEIASHWIGADPRPIWHWAIAFSIPFIAFLPATVAMGATLPAIDRWLASQFGDSRAIGFLYATNTAGAVCGVLLSALVIVPEFGFKISLLSFGVMNLCCAALAWIFDASAPSNSRDIPLAVTQARYLPRLFVAGLLGIGYEMVGVRVLSQVLENTIYTFAAVLSVFLLGTTIGGAFYQRWGRGKQLVTVLNQLVILLATACLMGTALMSHSQSFYDFLRKLVGDTPAGVFAAEGSVALLVFLLPTIGMGALFSHLVQHSRGAHAGVGKAAASNILGGALAPIAFGVMLLPWLGARSTLLLLGLAYLSLLMEPRKVVAWVVLPGIAAAFVLFSNLHLVQKPLDTTVTIYKEGMAASVAVLEDANHDRTLRVNNRFQMGGTAAAAAEYRHAHIPLLLHPHPRRALFLGLGSGISLGGTSFYPGLSTDGVELLPEVIEVMPQFAPYNFSPVRDPRIHLHVADARRYVRATTNQFDVIVADLFHPALDGAGALYTREHFAAIRSRLAAGGLFCQWLPMHQLDEEMLRVITRTFTEVFPEASAWLLRFNVDAPVLGLVGFAGAPHFTPNWIEARLGSIDLEKQLKSQSLADSVRFFGCLLAGPKELRDFAGLTPLNTDAFPRVIFGAPRFSYKKDANGYGRLLLFLGAKHLDPRAALGLTPGAEMEAFAERLTAYVQGRDVYLSGLIAQAEGHADKALDLFVESARLSPDFTPGYAQALSVASMLAKTRPVEARTLLERLDAAQPSRPVAREMLEKLFGK